jgi:glutamyl endopeptidase
MVRFKVRRLAWVGLAAFLLFAVSAAAHPRPANPHQPVSSDDVLPAPESWTEQLGVDSFPGFSPETRVADFGFFDTGAAVDGAAEITEAPEEFLALLELSPVSSPLDEGDFKTILGRDQRVRVNPTTIFPARATALVSSEVGTCTGWLFGPDLVVTAGHCVHSGGPFGDWYSDIRVYPGRNGSASPYGSCSARRLYSVLGWTDSSDEQYDYGAIKLSCTAGNSVGWFGVFWQTASLNGVQTTVAGYPGDKPLTQWKSTGPIGISQTRQVFYQMDTAPGESGAPVYQQRRAGSPACSGACVLAIHTQGLHGTRPHSNNNHGTRITQDVFNNLVQWKNAQ